MKKALLNIFAITISISLLKPVFASDTKSLLDELDEIDNKYKTGYCTTLLKSGIYNDELIRIYLLSAREDTLGFLIGRNTLTSEWIGNPSNFQIGRNVNTAFFEFANLAESSTEIKNILIKDTTDLSSTLEKLDAKKKILRNGLAAVKHNPLLMTTTDKEKEEKAKEIMLQPFFCHIYQIVMDENSKAAIDFKAYTRNVQLKAAGDMREALQKSIQELGY